MNRSLAIAAHCDATESAGDRGVRTESIQGRHWPEGVCTRPGRVTRPALSGASPAESVCTRPAPVQPSPDLARSFRLGGARRFAVDRYAAHGAHPGRGRPRPAPVQPRRYRADSGPAEPIQARCRPGRLEVSQYKAGTGPSESVPGPHCEAVQG